jgi:CHAT domain-containing protein
MRANLIVLTFVTVVAVHASALHQGRHSRNKPASTSSNRAGASSDEGAQAALRRALYLADLYNWHSSRPYFVKAHRLFQAVGDKSNALYARLGAIRAGAYPAPIDEQSYKLSQELAANPILQSDKRIRMFCLIVKGDFDGEVDVPAMRRDWTEVVGLAKDLGSTKWQYRAQGQLGFADFYEGDLAAAQRKVGTALIEATSAHDVGAQVFYLTAAANGFLWQQMNDQAMSYAEQAIDVANQNADIGYPLLAQHAKLLAMIQAGRIKGAQVELNTLIERATRENDPYQLADLYSTASLVARAQKNIPKAISSLDAALHYAQTGYGTPTSQIQSELSALYRLSGNLEKAEEFARGAAQAAQATGNIPRIPPALDALAQVHIDKREYADADRIYDRAANIQDTMIGDADSTLGKTALIKAASDLYAKHFALVAEHIGDTEKAFAIIEQVRGRVMTDLLVAGASSSPESKEIEKQIARLRLRLMAARSDRKIKALRNQIFFAEQNSLIAPEISILRSSIHRVITLKQVEGSLSGSEAILEYVVNDPASYCLVITHDSAKIVKLPGTQMISGLVSAYLPEVKAKHSAHLEARHLYDALLGQIPEVVSKKQLVVIPDGQLHLIPFDALIDQQGQFLLLSRTIVYSPSATSFFLLRTASKRKPAGLTILAVGGVPYDGSDLKAAAVTRGYNDAGLPNLPGSREEALSAAAAFPIISRTLLLGTDATESRFKSSIDRDILHLAVHAIANETHPDRAALVLLSDPTHDEDGFLEASEIVQLRLHAELVVLSACNTAVGPLEGQEGIATLSRAFLLAGAHTVISTLWSVEDESTLYLMRVFYAELDRRKGAANALATAKRDMVQKFGNNALPFYWAGFIVEGATEAPIGQ